jgi:hypothetical protein
MDGGTCSQSTPFEENMVAKKQKNNKEIMNSVFQEVWTSSSESTLYVF